MEATRFFWGARWVALALCVLSLVAPLRAHAQAQPVAHPENVNRAVSGALQNAMQRRGFAANDPRYVSTLSRATPVLAAVAGGAAAVTVGAVTAPAWATAAAAIVIGTVISYAVGVGLDALVHWLFNPNGTVDQSSQTGGSYPDCSGNSFWRGNVNTGGGQVVYGCNPEALARQVLHLNQQAAGSVPSGQVTCSFEVNTVYCAQPNGGSAWMYRLTSDPPVVCGGASYAIGSSCQSYSYPLPQPVPNQSGVTVPAAIQALPVAELDKPLNPVIVAALANRVWQQTAAQPGYDGLPYPQANPVTTAEAASWIEANPQYAPTVRDFVAPNPQTSANPTPWAVPGAPAAAAVAPVPANQGSTNPGNGQPVQNLGADPGIGSPQLEAAPTAADIAAPVVSMLPQLRGFQATGLAGECPRPVIELYGTHVLEAHCQLIEANKALIQAAMVFAWAALALFIVLSA